MKKLKVLMMGGMLAAGICLFAACGTANDDGTNNGVNDTSNTQVTTQENIPGTDNTTGNGTTDNNTDATKITTVNILFALCNARARFGSSRNGWVILT